MPANGEKNFLHNDLLEQGLTQLNIPQVQALERQIGSVIDLLQKFIEEIELFNEAYGLVKTADRKELIIKHIFDSLAPINYIPHLNDGLHGKTQITRIADVGSGAGLPGIPLAICLPGFDFTLIERMGRRAGFLRNCIAVLGLTNVLVAEAEMEKVEPGGFDIAIFRAFRPLDREILHGLLRLLVPGGILAAWKGRYINANEEINQLKKLIPELLCEITPVTVPFLEEERHLVLIGK